MPGLEVFSSGLFGSGWFHTVLGLLSRWVWVLLGCSGANPPTWGAWGAQGALWDAAAGLEVAVQLKY